MCVCSDSKTSPERKISVLLYLWTVLASLLKHFVLPVMLFLKMYFELWEHLRWVYSLNFKITLRGWEVMCISLHSQTIFIYIFKSPAVFVWWTNQTPEAMCVCVCVLQRRKINDCSNNIMMISQETKSSQTLSLTQTRSDEQPGQSETQNGNDSSCKQAFYNDGKALSLVHTHTHRAGH